MKTPTITPLAATLLNKVAENQRRKHAIMDADTKLNQIRKEIAERRAERELRERAQAREEELRQTDKPRWIPIRVLRKQAGRKIKVKTICFQPKD